MPRDVLPFALTELRTLNSTPCFQQIADDIVEQGWSVTEQFLSSEETRAFAEEAAALWESGEFRAARVGRGEESTRRPEIRSDAIHWIEPAEALPCQLAYLQRMDAVRVALNRSLFLGLFDFEAHLAVYPPGASYARHLDAFQNQQHRVISAIVYLNTDWSPEDGGALRLHLGGDASSLTRDISPLGGTLVLFLADAIEHEVLPARRHRTSVTGWFRRRALDAPTGLDLPGILPTS